MAILDHLTSASRRWVRLAATSTELLYRAAAQQGWQCNVPDPRAEAQRLAGLYAIEEKPRQWTEYGDIAFHLAIGYLPDLAYVVLYCLRHVRLNLAYDPIPYILKAIEELPHLRPERVRLHLPMTPEVQAAIASSEERARRAARVLVREICCVPLRHASGIYATMDPAVKPAVEAELRAFSPRAAAIIRGGSMAHLLTWSGFTRWLLRLLFGRDE